MLDGEVNDEEWIKMTKHAIRGEKFLKFQYDPLQFIQTCVLFRNWALVRNIFPNWVHI